MRWLIYGVFVDWVLLLLGFWLAVIHARSGRMAAMNPNVVIITAVGFVPIWLTGAIVTVVLYLNRLPGAPWSADLMFHPEFLNERGKKARRWGFGVMAVGAAWMIGGAIIGMLFHL